ncbi:hypothetical protein LGM69_25270 [Burkholderia multivorans]|nr:hypothetical protein [Burkholderia multivorans]
MRLKTYRLNTLALDLLNARRVLLPLYVLIYAPLLVADLLGKPGWIVAPAIATGAALALWWVRRYVHYLDLRRVAWIVAQQTPAVIAATWPRLTIEEVERRDPFLRAGDWLLRRPVSEWYRRPVTDSVSMD